MNRSPCAATKTQNVSCRASRRSAAAPCRGRGRSAICTSTRTTYSDLVPTTGTPNVSGFGETISGSLEMSNVDMATEFIELAGKINQQMPYHCVAKLQRTLNDRGRAVRGARIAVLGVSYKPGVGDVRESPALKIIELLRALGADVVYHDRFVAALEAYGRQSAPLAETLAGSDLAVIVTAHTGIDYDALTGGEGAAACVLDLRGVTQPAANVVRL